MKLRKKKDSDAEVLTKKNVVTKRRSTSRQKEKIHKPSKRLSLERILHIDAGPHLGVGDSEVRTRDLSHPKRESYR